MLNPNADKLKDPVDLDPTDQAFIDNESESQDSDIDMNNGTHNSKDQKHQSSGNTGHTGNTDESGKGTAANSGDKQQPSNNNQPPKQPQSPDDTDNKDSDELRDDDLEDEYPYKPEITPISMNPDKIMTKKFLSHVVILTNDVKARILDPRSSYESYVEGDLKHMEIFLQSRTFNIVQWFKDEYQVILPPFAVAVIKSDLEKATFTEVFKQLQFMEVQNCYTLYLLIIYIRHANPKLFEQLVDVPGVKIMLQFAFRPTVTFLHKFNDFKALLIKDNTLRLRGEALVSQYVKHTFEQALLLLESTLFAQLQIVHDGLLEYAFDGLLQQNTLQYFSDYVRCVLERTYLCITYYVSKLITRGKRGALLQLAQDLIFKVEEYVTLTPSDIPEELREVNKTAVGQKRKRPKNVFDFASENMRKKTHSETLEDLFSHNTHSQKHQKNNKNPNDAKTKTTHQPSAPSFGNATKPTKTQDATQATTNTSSTTRVPPGTNVFTGNVNQNNDDSKEDPYPQYTRYFTLRKSDFETQYIKEIMKDIKLTYHASSTKEAIELIYEIRKTMQRLKATYKDEFYPQFLVVRCESNMGEKVKKRWKQYLELKSGINFENLSQLRQPENFIQWIVKDMNLKNAYKHSYAECHEFKPSIDWKPTLAIDEFQLVHRKHEFARQFANANDQIEFFISIPEQILIILNSLHINAQKAIKQYKQDDNHADIRREELRRKESQLPAMSSEQLRLMQQNTQWKDYDQFQKHAEMYENFCTSRGDFSTHPKTITSKSKSKRKKKPKGKAPKNTNNSAMPLQPFKPNNKPSFTTPKPRRKYNNRDKIFDIVGKSALTPQGFIKTEVLVDYINKNGKNVAYRPYRCKRKCKNGEQCKWEGHSALWHDAVMKVKGCAKHLQNKFNGEHNRPRTQQSTKGGGRGNGKSRGKWYNRGKDKSKGGSDKNQISIVSQDPINIQPNGRNIYGNLPQSQSSAPASTVAHQLGYVQTEQLPH